jgi:hypothetical protein
MMQTTFRVSGRQQTTSAASRFAATNQNREQTMKRWPKIVGLVLTYFALIGISLTMGWLLRSCQDERECTTMFYAKGSQLECHK